MAVFYGNYPGSGGGGSGSNASVGSNTQPAPISSTEVGFVDGSGNLQPFSGTSAASGPNVAVTSSALPSGAATSANQTSQITQETTTANNTGTIATNTGTIATNTNVSTNGAATSALQTTGNSSLSTIATNTNVGTNGAATSALQTTGNTSLASLVTGQTNNTQTVASTGPVAPGTAATKSDLVGCIAATSALSATNGQQYALQGDLAGNLKVNLETALPTGTNSIGNLGTVTTVTGVTTVSTVSSVTSSQTAIPGTVTDVSSAALTTTTTSGPFTPGFGSSYMVNIAVTAVSGTTPTLVVQVQESADGGTNYYTVYTFSTITATGSYNSPVITLTGRQVRYVQTVAGTTPSFTRAIVRLQSSQSNFTQPTGTTYTDRSGTTSGTPSTSTQLAPVNQTRRYLLIQNLSASTPIYINFTSAATAGSGSFYIAPLGSYVSENSTVSTEAVNVLATVASIAFTAKEG